MPCERVANVLLHTGANFAYMQKLHLVSKSAHVNGTNIYSIKKFLNFSLIILKKMGDLIEPGTHRSTNIKVKIETVEKIRNVF